MRWFTPEEFGGPDIVAQLDGVLLEALDRWRDRLGRPVVIHPGGLLDPRPGRLSQHPLGRAVDCHVPGMPLLDAWLAAEAIPEFRGIGLYPWWRPQAGLHVDTREARARARWWQDRDGRYQALTGAALARLIEAHAGLA